MGLGGSLGRAAVARLGVEVYTNLDPSVRGLMTFKDKLLNILNLGGPLAQFGSSMGLNMTKVATGSAAIASIMSSMGARSVSQLAAHAEELSKLGSSAGKAADDLSKAQHERAKQGLPRIDPTNLTLPLSAASSQAIKAGEAFDKMGIKGGQAGEVAAGGFRAMAASMASTVPFLKASHLALTAWLLTGLLVIAALFKLANKAADWGMEVQKLSRVMGVGAREGSQLAFVFLKYGLSTDKAAMSMMMFSKGLNNNRKTLKEYWSDAELTTMKNQSLSDSFAMAIEKYSELEGPIKKNAFVHNVMTRGMGNVSVQPILDAGPKEFKASMESAKDSGLSISDKQMNDARKFRLEQRELALEFKSLGIGLGNMVLPAFLGLLKLVNRGIEFFDKIAQSVGGFEIAGYALITAWNPVIGILAMLGNLLSSDNESLALMQITTENTTKAMEDAAKGFGNFITGVFKEFNSKLEEFVPKINATYELLAGDPEKIVGTQEALAEATERLSEIQKKNNDKTKQSVQELERLRNSSNRVRDAQEKMGDISKKFANHTILNHEETIKLRDAQERLTEAEHDEVILKQELHEKSIVTAADKRAEAKAERDLVKAKKDAADATGENSIVDFRSKIRATTEANEKYYAAMMTLKSRSESLLKDGFIDEATQQHMMSRLKEMGPEAYVFLEKLAGAGPDALKDFGKDIAAEVSSAKKMMDLEFIKWPPNITGVLEAARKAAFAKMTELGMVFSMSKEKVDADAFIHSLAAYKDALLRLPYSETNAKHLEFIDGAQKMTDSVTGVEFFLNGLFDGKDLLETPELLSGAFIRVSLGISQSHELLNTSKQKTDDWLKLLLEAEKQMAQIPKVEGEYDSAGREFMNAILGPKWGDKVWDWWANDPPKEEKRKAAHGGIVTKPTWVFMGEENKKEAIIPLEGANQLEGLLGGSKSTQWVIQDAVIQTNDPMELARKIEAMARLKALSSL